MDDPTGAPLRLYVCGRVAAARGAATVLEPAFPARQGRRLWVYLVLNRQQPISRDDLAGAVWGDAIPDAWDDALNVLLSRLRRCLRPIVRPDGPRLVGEVGRCHVHIPPLTVVDLERARLALHRADVLMRERRLPEALAEARVATEIAARGFLAGEAGAWVEGQRRLLASVRLHALEYTVEGELLRGHADTAEREAEQLLALDPLRERSHALLMQASAAAGNASSVLRLLRECRRTLAAEGLEPSPALERLAAELARRER